MSGQQGVKETKELAVGLIAIAALLAKNFKDGIQAADAVMIFDKLKNDAELKEKLESAYKDIEMVKGEVSEIDFAEVIEIFVAVMPEFKNLIEAIKG